MALHQQVKLCRGFELLNAHQPPHFEGRTRHHRPVVGEQHRMMPAGIAAHCLGEREIARRVVGDQRQRPNAHDVVSRQWRQQIVRVETREQRNRHRMRRVQMNDRLIARLLLVHGKMREVLLDGGSPERWLPFQSSLESRDGSSLPRLEPVGVNNQPSRSAPLMLPVEPCVRPRSKMDLPSSQI